jgi:hypothetical protein
VLVVRSPTKYQSKHPVQVVASSPTFERVSATGASPVTVSGASAPTFTVEASDGSDVRLSGPGGARLVVTLSGGQHGGARLEAVAYPAAAASVALSGGASARVAASGAIDGTAQGAGTRLENAGAGTCAAVTASDGAEVACPAP